MDPNGIRTEPLMADPFEDTEHVASPPSDSGTYATLPPGWAAAVSPKDGRMYYYEKSTGKTSWTHPSVAQPVAVPFPAPAPVPPPAPVPVPALAPAPATKSNVTSTLSMDSDVSGIIAARSMKSHDGLMNDSIRPKRYQCYSVLALVLFFPLGIFALISSLKVDSAWDAGRQDAGIRASRRALLLSRISVAIGAAFWIWFIFFRGPGGLVFDFRPLFEW